MSHQQCKSIECHRGTFAEFSNIQPRKVSSGGDVAASDGSLCRGPAHNPTRLNLFHNALSPSLGINVQTYDIVLPLNPSSSS